MPIRVQLENDKILELNVDPTAWKQAFELALERGETIEVENPRGEVLNINPQQIQFWTRLPEWEALSDRREPAEAAPA